MDIKKLSIAAVSIWTLSAAGAASWQGLDESNWYAGPKITAGDLAGKVVLVDEWGVNCPPCRALLPSMQKYWGAFKNKNFILLGSHRQGRSAEKVAELVKENKLTYPIYEHAGLASDEPGNGGGLPFMYVVNHRGKVVYSGRDHQAAIEAAQEAIIASSLPPTLTGNVIISKKSPYKGYDKLLMLGKNIAAPVKKLEGDVKKGQGKAATAVQKAQAEQAQELLDAIESAKKEILEEIDAKEDIDPEEALKLAKAYMKTFPKEGADLKDRLGPMAEKAKAKKAEKAGAKK